jgi:hypothetical protein
MATTIIIRRVEPGAIEYEVIQGVTYHADRRATFSGPHGAKAAAPIESTTLWRAEDSDMVAAFRERYPDAEIML